MAPERRPTVMKSWVKLVSAIVVVQGVFAFWLLTLLFYRAGSYFLDAGFYIYAVASGQAPSTPPLVRDAWGDNVFLTHTTISPMAISAVLRPLLGVPLNFLGYLTIQHMLIALAGASIFSLGGHLSGASKRTILVLGGAGAIALPMSNVGLGSLAYPHVEILGSSSIALGVCILVAKWTMSPARWMLPAALFLFVIGVLAREDLGGHLAIATFAAVLCAGPRSLTRNNRNRALVLIGGGAFTTIALLMFQRVIMGSDGSFDISYSGEPAYAHITSVWYLVERFSFFIGSRLDLLGGITIFVLFGVIYRRPTLLSYPLACIPWILLNVTSVDSNKHSMGIYGMFPMVIYLSAPLLSHVLSGADNTVRADEVSDGSSRRSVPGVREIAYLALGMSFVLGGVAGPPNGGGYVYHSLLRYPVIGPGEISLVHRVIEDFATEQEGIAVDDAVMTLEPVILQNTQLISRIQEPTGYTSLLFFPNFSLGRAQVRAVFSGWINDGSSISISCLPGGMARADKLDKPPAKELTPEGQLNRAGRCHRVPSL